MKKFILNLNIFVLISSMLISGSTGSYFVHAIMQTKQDVPTNIVVKDTSTTNPQSAKPTTAQKPSTQPQAKTTATPAPSRSNVNPTKVPSTGNQGTTEYYSPSLDITFTYSKDELQLMDSVSNVSVYIAGSSAVAISYGKIEKSTASSSKDLIDSYTKKYVGMYPSAKVQDVNETNSSAEFTIAYDYKNFLDNSTSKRYQYIYAKKMSPNFVVLDYTYSDGFDISTYKNAFKSVIDSATAQSSAGTSSALSTTIKDGNMSLDYDKKKWNVMSQSDSSISLYFRSSDYEKDSALKYSLTSINIRATTTSSPVDEDYLLKQLSYDVDAYSSYSPTMLTTDEQVSIDGITFYRSKLSYSSASTQKIRTMYWGYEPASKAVISISVNTEDESSEGAKEIEPVLQSITFSKTSAKALDTRVAQATQKMFNIGGEVYAAEQDTQVEVQSSTILGKSAIAHIFNKTCLEINVSDKSNLPYSGGKTYDVCTAGFGTGFYINADGHLITNAHVANPNATDAVVNSLKNKDNPFVKDFAQDVAALMKAGNYSINSDEEFAYVVVASLLKMVEKKLITITPTYENYIEGFEPFKINRETYELENADKHYTTKTVDSFELESNYQMALKKMDKEKVGITVPDLTLLSVTSANKPVFPALALGDEEIINVGEKIKVIGFPGSANSEEIFGDAASSIASVTEGSVSAIKPNFNNTFKMVQIDASVSFGNSGGPIINTKGDVVGVVTYKISGQESADFNAGISVKEVEKFLKKNNIANDVGATHSLLKAGINNFSKGYYKRALVNLEQVKKAYKPTEEVVNPLIKTAQQQIEQGNDKTPSLSLAGYDATGFQMIGLMLSVLVFAISALLLVMKLIGSKNNDEGNKPDHTPQEVPEPKKEIVEPKTEESHKKETESPTSDKPSRFAPPKE